MKRDSTNILEITQNAYYGSHDTNVFCKHEGRQACRQTKIIVELLQGCFEFHTWAKKN